MKTKFLIVLSIVVIYVLISYGYLSNYTQNYNSEINKTKYLANQPAINVTGIIQHWQPIDVPSYSIIPEEDIDVEMNKSRGIFLYGKLNPSLEGKQVTISGILIENYADFHSKTLGGVFGGDPHTAVILVENVLSSESVVTDSLKIPNAERDTKLAAGYKLYPGVGWVHPDDQGNQEPIYRDNLNNPGELILDFDAMIKESDALNSKGCPQFCSKKVANNVFSFCGGGGFYSENYVFTNNSTHSFVHNECEWIQNENSEPLDIASIEDGRIKLYPVDTCAGIVIDRLTLDELNQRYPATFTTKSGKTYEIKFLSINDDDFKEMPIISELIRVTHQIPFPLNGGITTSKGLLENPDWVDYLERYDQKKIEQFNLDEVQVRGFVYNEEYYGIGFSIC